MDNRQGGRQRVGGGQGKTVGTHGAGLGTGPVGKQDGYSQRPGFGGGRRSADGAGESGGDPTRGILSALMGGKKSKLILIVIVIALVVIFGRKFFKFSNNSDIASTGFTTANGTNGTFTGWTATENTGAVNTTVSPEARARYTEILGNGQDKATVMVYMCGTDLESKYGMGSNDLNEMRSATIGSNVNVIVYTGGCKQWKTGGISNTVNQVWEIRDGKVTRIAEDSTANAMTNPNTLSGFIKFCAKNYPANRKMLILWDHGGGTISGYGYDEKNASAGSMTLAKLSDALKATGETFDFIGFDACLMATLETALVLDPYTDYMIASEETEPGIGWYYTNWLTQLSADTSVDTVTLGKTIVDDFVTECAKKCPGQKTTLSVIDIAELSQTVGADLSSFSASTANLISGDGYATVSTARANTREFSVSSKIDQVDLVHLALNINTPESKALAKTLQNAVKYNRTSSNMTDAYGISAYFPYRNAGKVNSAVSQLSAIGMDDGYMACVRKFASLEVSGQAYQGGSASPFGSLFSGSSGSSVTGSAADIIGALLGGGGSSSSVGGLSDFASLLGGFGFADKSLDANSTANYVQNNTLDAAALTWTDVDGEDVLVLTDKDWALVNGLMLNVFLDDGKGYIDLGLDNIYSFTDYGALIGSYDGMWVALDSQPVAYYFESSLTKNGETVSQGYIPVLLNGERAELLVEFTSEKGSVVGARTVYKGEDAATGTVAKAVEALSDGDVIQPICDRYTYDGAYEDSFRLGDEIVWREGLEVTDVTLTQDSGKPVASYVLTDVYGMEHWTPAVD